MPGFASPVSNSLLNHSGTSVVGMSSCCWKQKLIFSHWKQQRNVLPCKNKAGTIFEKPGKNPVEIDHTQLLLHVVIMRFQILRLPTFVQHKYISCIQARTICTRHMKCMLQINNWHLSVYWWRWQRSDNHYMERWPWWFEPRFSWATLHSINSHYGCILRTCDFCMQWTSICNRPGLIWIFFYDAQGYCK